jgi:hypothetical protein
VTTPFLLNFLPGIHNLAKLKALVALLSVKLASGAVKAPVLTPIIAPNMGTNSGTNFS